MFRRSKLRYSLDECLYIISKLETGSTTRELEELVQRSINGLRKKKLTITEKSSFLENVNLLDITSMKQLYQIFEAEYPDDPYLASQDISTRIERFEKQIKKLY